jgi:hypothetical protein
MVYNIPEWPADSIVNHTATTWVLARDEDFTNIEEQLDESEEQLLVWEIDKIIPTREIWYIKALRKLEDEDGNDLNNTKWIGPKPVFSDESSVNEYLAPKFYIDTPYIQDVVYKDSEYLEFTITPYKTNVGYINTALTVEDVMGNTLLTKFFNVDETLNKLRIDIAELDFVELNDIKVTMVHNGTQSTMSAPVSEILNLKNAHFKITGNTKELDPTYNNTLKVVSTTVNGVTAVSAKLKNRAGEALDTLQIVNNEITIKNNLEFRKEYLVEVTVQYTKADGSFDTTKKTVIVTTRDTDEITIASDKTSYEDKLTIKNSTQYGGSIYNYDLDRNFNTEELFTYSIPLPDSETGKVSLFGLDKDNFNLSKHMEDALNLEGDFTLRLLTKTKGVVLTTNDDNIVIVTPFTYDPYTDNVSLGNALNTNFTSSAAFVNKIAQLTTGIFIAGIDNDDKTLLKVKEFNIDTMSLTDKYTYTLPAECTDIAVSELGNDKVLLIPNCPTDDVFRTYNYSSIEDYTNESVAIPGEFRGKNLLVNKLYDGRVVMFKHNDNEDAFNYAIYDNKTESTITTEVDMGGGTKTITNIVALKNGDILTVVKNTDSNDNAIAEFWVFY